MDDKEKTEMVKKMLESAFPNEKIVPNNITAIVEFLKKSNVEWKPDEETKKQGIEFLDESIRDMTACRALSPKWWHVGNKTYPDAVYHLQQAVEKAAKGYCLGTGILSIQDIRSHDTPYLLLKAIFEKTGLKELLSTLDQEAKTRLDKAWESIENLEIRLKIAKIDVKQIQYHLSEIDTYKLSIMPMIENFSKIQTIIDANVKTTPVYIRTLVIMTCIYILGVLTFPHEAFTRYPDGQITPKEYIKALGIVKAIPYIISYLSPAVKELRQIFFE